MADDRSKSKTKSWVKSKKSKIKTKDKEKDKDKDKDKVKDKGKDKEKDNVSSKPKKSSPDPLAKDRKKVPESSKDKKAPATPVDSSKDKKVAGTSRHKNVTDSSKDNRMPAAVRNSKESIQSRKDKNKRIPEASKDRKSVKYDSKESLLQSKSKSGKPKSPKESDKKSEKGQRPSRPSNANQHRPSGAANQYRPSTGNPQPQPHRPRQAQAIGASPDMSDINKAFAEIQGAKPIKTTTSEQRKIMASVVRLQWKDGHFMLSPNLAVLFGHDYNSLKKDATDHEFIGNAYATQLAIHFIDNRLTDVKPEMQKEYDKAVSWLVTNYPDQVPKLKSVADTYYPKPKERHRHHKKRNPDT